MSAPRLGLHLKVTKSVMGEVNAQYVAAMGRVYAMLNQGREQRLYEAAGYKTFEDFMDAEFPGHLAGFLEWLKDWARAERPA